MPMKRREKNTAFNVKKYHCTCSFWFKDSLRESLWPCSPVALSHFGQGYIEKAVIKLVKLDYLFFFNFWWVKWRQKHIDTWKEKGTEKKGKNIISISLWLSCWKMSSLQPALVSDLRGKLWQRAGSSQRVYHGIRARHFLGRQMRCQEEEQAMIWGQRGACSVGLPQQEGDVTRRPGLPWRLDPSSSEVPAPEPRAPWRIPPAFASVLVTHTELEKKKKDVFLNIVILGSWKTDCSLGNKRTTCQTHVEVTMIVIHLTNPAGI